MLNRKIRSAHKVFREAGIKGIVDVSWIKLQIIVKTHNRKVRIDKCTFGLDGIFDGLWTDLITSRYEISERRAIARYLPRDLPVVELGASIGVVSCITNKLLKDPTAHVVVEANPGAIPQLQLNKKRNRCLFEIVNKAIAYNVDFITFRPSSNTCGTSITEAGDQAPVTVQTIQLRNLVRDRGFGNFTLVCDIEGLEYDMICQEADVLKNAHTIILETHARFIGEDKFRLMMDRLREIGFRLVQEIGFVVVLQH